MKHPLLSVTLCYAGGILLADNLALPLVASLGIGLALAAVCLFSTSARKYLIWLLVFVAGVANQTLERSALSPIDLRKLPAELPIYATLRGKLSETPYLRIYEHEKESTSRTVAELIVESISEEGKSSLPAVGRVAISTPGQLSKEFFGGAQVEISGTLNRPPGPVAEGLFDYRKYLERQGVYFQLQVKSADQWHRVATNETPPISDRFLNWAQRTLARGLPGEDESLRLLWAMTLGWKTGLSGDISEHFMRSGTVHVFAISGLHIALISGALIALLRVFKVPRAWCGILVVPLIWFYTGVTGWQASAIRSTIMMSIVIGGWSLRRPSDLFNSLAAAALIILIWEPQQLFQAGFQLSFAVVWSIALFVPVMEKIKKWCGQPDPFLPKELRPKWRQWLDRPVDWVVALVVSSFAAWLGSMPFVAYYFHLFTPISLLANLVVVPLSSLALTSNVAGLICADWLPWCGELFNHSAWFLMSVMVAISKWAAHLNGGSFYIMSPGPVVFLAYYAALMGVMLGWFGKPRLKLWLGSGLAILGVIWLWQAWSESRVSRLTILPLRGGTSIYLDNPGRANDFLLDCGDESSARFVTKPFLATQGVNSLERLFLSHGDVRHVGGAVLIQHDFNARHVAISAIRFRSPIYRQLQTKFEAQSGLIQIVERGERLGNWEVLHPDKADRVSQADDSCLVLAGSVRGTRLLLLSDLGRAGQILLAERKPDLKTDIVVSGLPDQSEPIADGLIEMLQPKLIIIADTLSPGNARAPQPLRERLAKRNIPVVYLSDVGTVTLEFREKAWSLRAMDSQAVSR